MNLDLNQGVTVLHIVTDDKTPQTHRAYNGWTRPITNAQRDALPSGVGNSITIDGVIMPGYKRVRGDRLEWVISPAVDPVIVMFEAMPGPKGWADPAARAVWAEIGLALLNMGVDRDVFIDRYPDLYDAAVANYQAQQAR